MVSVTTLSLASHRELSEPIAEWTLYIDQGKYCQLNKLRKVLFLRYKYLKPETACTLLTQAGQYLTTVYQSVYHELIKINTTAFEQLKSLRKVYQARS